jgi:uncharacterized membrane protein YfcA
VSVHIILMLYAAGAVGGMLSSLVGGAAVVTYPALIASGIPPLSATVCNLTASFPGTMFAALSDRGQLPPFDRAFVTMLAASTLTGALGGALLLATPERFFEILVPLLLGFATLLFAFAQRAGDWLRARAVARGRDHQLGVADLKLVLPVSFYGGYFGAGVGFLMLGVMSVATGGHYRSANVAKNFIMSLNTGAAAAIFIVKGTVIWPQTLALMAGTVSGGLTGAWLARVVPRGMMRVAVIILGALLTIYFARRYWF